MGNDYSEIRRQLTKYGNVQSLMRYINENSLIYKNAELDGSKATGVDKIAKADYVQNIEENIEKLIEDMKQLKYKPLPVRRVFIPKANGKLRPLGIPSYEDKLVQE